MEPASNLQASLAPYAQDFGPFDGRVWLNASHQGPLPRVAIDAAERAVADKRAPYRIVDSAFSDVPQRLRRAIGQLIRADPDDIVLANSATYGLDLLARAIDWQSGDEILLVDGDFPADIYPWLPLRHQGVAVRFLQPHHGRVPDAEELLPALTARTRVFCTSWVNSFTGHVADPDALGRVCRDRNVVFILNVTQGLGARVLDVSRLPVDALICSGYKWLLGPYGTGFCWLAPALRASLAPCHAYWLPNVWGRSDGMTHYAMRSDLGARAYDVFDTANFLNFIPWTASLEYLLAAGPKEVDRYDRDLVDALVSRVDDDLYDILSPTSAFSQTTMVVVRPRRVLDARGVHAALASAGVDTSLREGTIRLSPHLYNTREEIDFAVHGLNDASRFPRSPPRRG